MDVLRTVQDQLDHLLRANRAVYFCEACLALKMGAFPREVHDALTVIGGRGNPLQAAPGRCSECLQVKPVIRSA
jgi:hypothetical protein